MQQTKKNIVLNYGCRVWNDLLCPHLRGQSATIDIILNGADIAGWLDLFMQQNFNNRCIIDHADPAFSLIVGGIVTFKEDDENQPMLFIDNSIVTGTLPIIPIIVTGTDETVAYKFDTSVDNINGAFRELLESFVVVNFVPTAENLSEWLYNIINVNTTGGVAEVSWSETPNIQSIFRI